MISSGVVAVEGGVGCDLLEKNYSLSIYQKAYEYGKMQLQLNGRLLECRLDPYSPSVESTLFQPLQYRLKG